jgi:D-arabinose 1-dehydrogenase-like Zn-dependent alcohol dehydrogenase
MSQKALLLEAVGKPLTLGERLIPQPGKNQLLVKVLVAGRKYYPKVLGAQA